MRITLSFPSFPLAYPISEFWRDNWAELAFESKIESWFPGVLAPLPWDMFVDADIWKIDWENISYEIQSIKSYTLRNI